MLGRVSARVAGVAALLAVGLAGCGPQAVEVTGRVSYQGKPVGRGSVTLVGSDNLPYTGAIQPDGTYTVASVPAGPVKIGVSTPGGGFRGSERPGGAKIPRAGGAFEREGAPPVEGPAPPSAVAVPDRYADPLTSGLSGVAKKGEPLNIELN
jgi:hypothetical protein